jgi:hypothetical protein
VENPGKSEDLTVVRANDKSEEEVSSGSEPHSCKHFLESMLTKSTSVAVAIWGFWAGLIKFFWSFFLEQKRSHLSTSDSHYLRFLWHLAVFVPLTVIFIVGYVLSVDKTELFLFSLGAASVVSLEICLSCILHKAEEAVASRHDRKYFYSLKNQTEQIRSAGDQQTAIQAVNQKINTKISELEEHEQKCHIVVSKMLLLTILCTTMFSVLVVLEVLRMQQASQPIPKEKILKTISEQIAASKSSKLQSVKQKCVDCDSTDKKNQPELAPAEDSKNAIPPPPSAQVASNFDSDCFDQKWVEELVGRITDTAEAHRHDAISIDNIVLSTFCGICIIVFSVRKLWVITGEQAQHVSEENESE